MGPKGGVNNRNNRTISERGACIENITPLNAQKIASRGGGGGEYAKGRGEGENLEKKYGQLFLRVFTTYLTVRRSGRKNEGGYSKKIKGE